LPLPNLLINWIIEIMKIITRVIRMATVGFASLFMAMAANAQSVSGGDPFADQLAAIQSQWAQVNYQVAKSEKEGGFKALAAKSAAFVTAHPTRAEAHVWHGIVLSSWAGARGGLGALDLAKQARTEYEQALKMDRKALQGSALASLGVLYFKVPGWPLGFGDDEKAEALLKEALAINPDGIDPNYFYADFLLDDGRKDQALVYVQRALKAPDRPGRALADKGRRDEAKALLARIQDAKS
jgi:tetratricopeptide (TPR) repeat protein